MLQLPEALELQLTYDIEQLEKEHNMPYVTAIERFAEKRGKQEGIQRGEASTLIKQLKLKFGIAPEWATNKINSATKDELDRWVERILIVESIESLFD
jgi:hypothetical protein